MSYEDLFSRYGSPRDEGEINVRAWFQRPEKLRTGADIKTADERAVRVIAECKAVIETMNELRARLTIRYNALETLPYHIRDNKARRIVFVVGDCADVYSWFAADYAGILRANA